jgi:aspartate/methionine/tyrosine aminotransferase
MKAQFRNHTPIDFEVVQSVIQKMNLPCIGKASIREIKKIIDLIENETGQKFIRMEMGIPGLPPPSIGTEAEINALRKGVASIYPDIDGTIELKTEISRFVKNFLDIDVNSESCIPTVGSMQGSFAAFLTLARLDVHRDTTLFIDPGFPVHKQQHKVLGQKFESFDVYEFRGDKVA